MNRTNRSKTVVLTALTFASFLWQMQAQETGGDRKTYAPDQGRHAFVFGDATWTDATRKREVPVRIYSPRIDTVKGKLPTVVFSHGGGESREAFGYLGQALARNGYIVVFLTHKGNDRDVVDKGGMVALKRSFFRDRPRDVRFVMDRILSDDPGHELLKGRIDPARIAVAGQCAGSTTALAVAGLTTKSVDGEFRSYRDERARAVVALSPQIGVGRNRRGEESLHDDSWARVAIPALVVTGTRDFSWMAPVRANPRLVRKPYDALPPGDSYLVEISGAEHHAFTESKPYYPGGKRDPRHHGWIGQAVLAFLDGYLKGDPSAVAWLREKGLESATKGECRQEHGSEGKTGVGEPRDTGKATGTVEAAGAGYDFSELDRFLETSVSRMGGGCSLILIQGDRVIHRKAYGTFTPDKVVPIASSSKWISGGVIMALVDAGKISLEDKASRYLSYFTGKKGGITIRQMFSHTHGIAGNARDHLWNTSLTMDQAVRKIAECELKADPGEALYYSGLGMQVAARIAEIVKHKPWVEIFKETLGNPLGMKNTSYYAFGRTENPNVAGGVRTCVDDYGNYLTMLLNGGVFKGKRILSEKAVATMLANQSGNLPILRHPYAVLDCIDPALAKAPYGMGCWLEAFDEKTGKAREISSGGGFGCMPFLDLKRKLAGVFLPHSRIWKKDAKGRKYNDAHRVYYESKRIINGILDNTTPTAARTPTTENDRGAARRKAAGAKNDAGRLATRIIQRSDTDGDGSLTPDEAPARIAKGFKRIDRNQDGKISRDELETVLQRMGAPGDPDRDRSGAPGPVAPAAPPQSPSSPTVERKAELGPRKLLYKETRGPFAVKSVKLVELPHKKRAEPLQVRVIYPEGKGTHPVLVFSHCAGGSKDEYAPLAGHWASHGYVCILPDHPDSPAMRGDGPRQRASGNWRSRPEEAAMVLDNLGLIEQKVPGLRGRLDRERIGVGGHYIGSLAAGLLAGMTGFSAREEKPIYKDARVKAALMISPVGRGQGLTEKTWSGMNVPTLFVTGSMDFSRRTGNPPEWRTEPFKFCAPGNKYLAWIEGLKPAGGGARKNSREGPIWFDPDMDACVRSCTLAFWDAHLGGDKAAFDYLNTGRYAKDSGNRIRVTTKPRTSEARRVETQPVGTQQGSMAILPVNFEKAADYSTAHKGRAVLVMVDGKIVFERYANGYSKEATTHLHSATKGFWGPVVAAMIDDGLVTSFDELASRTLPEWKDDPIKRRITLRHLLSLNAGLVQDIVNLQGHDRSTLQDDLYKHAIGVRAVRQPGTAFQYGPSCYYVLGEIMKRKLADRKQTPLDYLKHRILDPIGVKVGEWVHDVSGNPHIPNGASLTARDWARFGQFIVQKGSWGGQQLVSAKLIEACFQPSRTNPGHGLALWLNRPEGMGSTDLHKAPAGAPAGWIYPERFPDLLGALGAGKCRMYMIPDLETVIVRQAEGEKGIRNAYVDSAFLRLLFEGREPVPAESAAWVGRMGPARGGRGALLLDRFDANGDGKIALDEIPKKARRLRAGFGRLDADKDGFLTEKELDAVGASRKE